MLTQEFPLKGNPDAEVRDRIEYLVLAFLAFANVFDLGGGFGLKYASYAFCALLLLNRRSDVQMARPVFLVCAVLFVVWPLISALQGIARGGDLGIAMQRVTAFAPALLVMPILASSREPRRLLDAVMAALLALAVVIVILFGLFLLMPSSALSELILAALKSGGHGYFGVRHVGSIVVPTVYFKATLFLVPACIWFFFKRKYLASAVCYVGLVLAFSRSGALIAGAVVFVHGFILAPLRVRIGLACTLVAIGYVVWSNAELLQIGAIFDMYLDVLSGRGHSSLVRAGHFNSIVELLTHDPQLLWLGQGAGVSFFSSGVNAFVSAVELDHLEAIRTFGLLWFICASAVVFRAAGVGIHLESQEARGLRIAVIAAFLAAGTNPVLLSPLFCILVAATYYCLSTERLQRHD